MQQQQLYPTCPPAQEMGYPTSPTNRGYPASPTHNGYPQSPGTQAFPIQQQSFMPQQSYPGPQQQSPQQATQQPQQQSVVYQRAHSRVWPRYRSKSSMVVGWTQIIIGVLCVACNVVGLCIQKQREYKELNATFMVGAGFWGAIFFFLSGGFALGAGRHKTTSMIVATMVFSIISTIFALAVLATGGSAIGVEKSNIIQWDHEAFFKFHEVPRKDTIQHRVSVAMGMILVGLALLEFVCCLWASIICCSAVCCGHASAQAMTMAQTQVVFMNTPQGAPQGAPGAAQTNPAGQAYTSPAGQPYTGVPPNQTVLITHPAGYGQPPTQYVSYPAAPMMPPSYDSTVGPTVEKMEKQ